MLQLNINKLKVLLLIYLWHIWLIIPLYQWIDLTCNRVFWQLSIDTFTQLILFLFDAFSDRIGFSSNFITFMVIQVMLWTFILKIMTSCQSRITSSHVIKWCKRQFEQLAGGASEVCHFSSVRWWRSPFSLRSWSRTVWLNECRTENRFSCERLQFPLQQHYTVVRWQLSNLYPLYGHCGNTMQKEDQRYIWGMFCCSASLNRETALSESESQTVSSTQRTWVRFLPVGFPQLRISTQLWFPPFIKVQVKGLYWWCNGDMWHTWI